MSGFKPTTGYHSALEVGFRAKGADDALPATQGGAATAAKSKAKRWRSQNPSADPRDSGATPRSFDDLLAVDPDRFIGWKERLESTRAGEDFLAAPPPPPEEKSI